MTEVVKVEEETTVEDAPEPVEDAPEDETPEDETPEKKPTDIDYKALADAETKRAEEAQKAAADLAFKLREQKREVKEEDPPEEDDNKPLTRADINQVLAEFARTNEKSTQDTEAKALIAKHVEGDEADAAYLFWKNRVVPTGNLEEDILFALGGLNYKRVIAQNSELKRSLQSKDTRNKDASGAVKDPTGTSETMLSSQDAQTLKASGMKWDGKKRLYSKKLKDGKTFFFDPKTKKRWKGE